MTTAYQNLNVITLADRQALGIKAAADAAVTIKRLLNKKKHINIIFAAAPSQSAFLESLKKDTSIAWERINAFHMDEYLGLPVDASQSFGNFLRDAIFGHVNFRSINYINGNAEDVDKERERYAHLLNKNQPDIVFMGIGENTHLAFNEPFQADFNDPEIIKVVTLDPVCRQQQVNDGCFQALDNVPVKALTLTIPVLLSAGHIFCMVPGINKADAVVKTLTEPISVKYPSTILRKHQNAILYLDAQSASLL
ncbi:glucosamine-6-phosphate deaminase [Mucilaginibacter gossypiicola]|uniref:Glucosamine-6-phosphate deaminase n=1 Tax=Mucilaginibacter gossypiicola TaxID=551995 RepID=A0A1H8A3G7_9SPHI|nr:glucosamine-6-phosphate deaminase [Mucilaginibacter gossypiicola]SEM64454.1 glucosamine-6-phosphate deaminase [Mucilaginibacter gossypiicola]